MQTFLPYMDFERTARVLDYKRLGKQRVECVQILKALRDPTAGWQSHPAVKMWRGYEPALGAYMNIMIREWIARGYRNTIPLYTMNANEACPSPFVDAPPWWGDEAFHASHRSNLLRKDAAYYRQFGWKEKDDMEYVWPVL